MEKDVFTPQNIEGWKNGSWLNSPFADTTSGSSTRSWDEPGLFYPECSLGLFMASDDELPGDPTCFENTSDFQIPISVTDFLNWPPIPPSDLDYLDYKSRLLDSTPMSTPSSSSSNSLALYHDERGGGVPSFHPASGVPSSCSRSTPRSSEVSPAQLCQNIPMDNPEGPCFFPELYSLHADSLGDVLSSFTRISLGDSEYDSSASFNLRYPYLYAGFDRDQNLTTDGKHPSSSPPSGLPPSNGGDRNRQATSIEPSTSMPGKEGSAGDQSVPQQQNVFPIQTAGTCGLYWSTTYLGLDDGQYSLETTIPPEPLEISACHPEPSIRPSSVSASPRVEVDRTLLVETGDGAAPTLDKHLMQPSARSPNFRPQVGSQAMTDACMKRRKRIDDRTRLFVCKVSGCGRTLTARHNWKYHMKSHNDIRDEICRDCGKGFVTRETLLRHQKRCKLQKRGCPSGSISKRRMKFDGTPMNPLMK